MQNCPRCGYREGVDGPSVLLVIAFGIVYLAFVLAGNSVPMRYREAAFVAFFMFLAAGMWRSLKAARNRRDYQKLHPPITERLKDHVRAQKS